jgi:hypothetical protein
MDGGAIYTYDVEPGVRRPATLDDWYLATRLGDCLDDIDVYWSAVEGCWGESPCDTVSYWKAIFQNFSKHVQEATKTAEQSRWLLEVLQVVFGSREEFRKILPYHSYYALLRIIRLIMRTLPGTLVGVSGADRGYAAIWIIGSRHTVRLVLANSGLGYVCRSNLPDRAHRSSTLHYFIADTVPTV